MPKTALTEIYRRYQIMPNLQQHMWRVAGVAQLICDNLQVSVDTENVVTACLLHDLGNILKFDLKVFPEFLQPEGAEYWQQVKAETLTKYGALVHPATIAMASEVGASQRVLQLIEAISFNQEKKNFESDDFGRKICAYADMRVAPWGVVSLDDRLKDGKDRYPAKSVKDERFRYAMNALLHKIEVQIFAVCQITAAEVTEAAVGPIIEMLKASLI